MNSQIESTVFPTGYRASGLLLHVTSLPSPHGIGSFGPEAVQWIDRLADAHQTWWQILPIGPPDKGNSPYTPLSTFACNPLLVSPEWMVDEGLLTQKEASPLASFPEDHVDFDRVIPWKRSLLDLAYANYSSNRDGVANRIEAEFSTFCELHQRWLDDFAAFVAIRDNLKGTSYTRWPAPLRHRESAAIKQAMIDLSDKVRQVKFDQFLAFRHLARVRSHAALRGIRLFGDLPIFVSGDSADVWSHPDLFMLDHELQPKFVAGVPPDYFSATGQLWGNPVYDWAALRRSGYAWWIDRLRSLMQQHDLVRLDHFRGFSAAWHIPHGAPTAETGKWVDGPGADFFAEVKRALDGLPFVAEDLGTITDDVRQLLADFGFPKMGVLQFAFDGDSTNAFLPHHSVPNMVYYTGTHDNDTSLGWYKTLSSDNQECLAEYLEEETPLDESLLPLQLLDLAWGTKSAVTIAPLQDLLGLGSEARMNTPGVASGNWAWRCTQDQMEDAAWKDLGDLTKKHHRAMA